MQTERQGDDEGPSGGGGRHDEQTKRRECEHFRLSAFRVNYNVHTLARSLKMTR